MSTAWKKDIQAIALEVGHRAVENKLKKKTSMQTFENVSWNKLNNFSETFSSLTKKGVGSFDKTFSQEMNVKTGKFEEILSGGKPMNKFSALPVRYCSTPLKNVISIMQNIKLCPSKVRIFHMKKLFKIESKILNYLNIQIYIN